MQKEMNQMKFCDLMQKLDEIIREYERKNINNHIYTLFNTNGKTIKFRILKKNVAHLVGIESTEKALQTVVNSNDMYEVMKRVINNAFNIYTKGHNGTFNFNTAFSKYIEDKILVFETLMFLNIKNIKYCVNYDKSKSYGVIDDKNNPFVCEYYLVLRTKDDKEAYLGLKYDDKLRCYVASSLISSKDNIRNLEYLLRNQTIAISNELVNYDTVTGYKTKSFLYYTDKDEIYHELEEICSIYNSVLDVSFEWNKYVNKLINYENVVSPSNVITERISKIIEKGDIIPNEIIEEANRSLRPDTKSIIKAYQNYTKSDLDDSIRLKKELKELKEKLKDLENSIKERDNFADEQRNYIKELEESNKSLTLFKKDITETINKYNK